MPGIHICGATGLAKAAGFHETHQDAGGALTGGKPSPMPILRMQRLTAVRRHDPVIGVISVSLAMVLFAGLAAFSRAAMNAGLDPFEVVFLRNLFAVLMLMPLLAWRGRTLLHSDQLGLYGWRVLVSLLSMQSWFYALSLIPIGELTAIGFLAPLFGTLGAVLVLGEIVRARRWSALVIGFIGAMIILRPAGGGLGAGQICALTSAFLTGLTNVLVKQLTARDDPDKIVFLTNLFMLPPSLIPALFVWTWPTGAVIPVLLGMGFCAVLGHVALVRGYAAMDASLAMSFEFSRLPFAVAIAYLAFGETIDHWTWIGALIIFVSAAYVTRREAMLRQHKPAPGQTIPR
jgi:drug/metabolite transporter (DMT)-like permease